MLILISWILLFQISSFQCKLTLDELLNYTDYSYFILSPNDENLILIQTRLKNWEENVNEYHLYLQDLEKDEKKLITKNCLSWIKPLWFDQWIVYFSQNNSIINNQQFYFIIFYSTKTQENYSIHIGKESIHSFSWSNYSNYIYYSTRTPLDQSTEDISKREWNNVIQFRDDERGDTIYRLNIDNFQIERLLNVSFRIAEMICSEDGNEIVFSTSSISGRVESMKDFEIYSFNLIDLVVSQLTNNNGIERNLKWFNNQSIFFQINGEGSVQGDYQDSQGKVYLFHLTDGYIQRWAQQFQGDIIDYDLLEDGIIVLGQLGTTIQIYTQKSFYSELIKLDAWNGSYQFIKTVNKSKIVFIYSSFESPQEIYYLNNIKELNKAKQITNENKFFAETNLPKGETYRWINEDDQIEIEGILLYPPDKFHEKNLSLLVLIHGGPYSADLNIFQPNWYSCATFFANEGWLVLQPNYRGSTGYGDSFLNGVLIDLVSRPGKDILFGVNSLIKDGIVDPQRLSIGGYSYGGYLTNWLITQTNIFNAALSGAGAVEHVSDWGNNDLPLVNEYFLGGFPWEKAGQYIKEGAIYNLNKVCTPTHILTGENDIRVPSGQSYLLERALYNLNIPRKLILFPGVGHNIDSNPWHEIIKLREEIKWLNKYGNTRPLACLKSSSYSKHYYQLQILFFIFILFIQ